MRILAFVLILFPLLTEAQEIPLFKIISQNGSVLLDGDSTRCGQVVTSKNQELKISGKDCYAIVITEAGYAFKLKRGNYTTEGIFKIKKSNLAEIRTEQSRGAVMREQIEDIWVMSMGYEYANAFHDSLTIIWKSQKPVGTGYTVRIVSMLDELLYDSIVNYNTLTVDLSEVFKTEKAVLFDIRAKKSSSRLNIIKKISEQDRLNVSLDLSCIPEVEFVEKTLLILAVCEVHNLYYDQIHYLYKLWRHEQVSGIKINHPYYQRLLLTHDFEYFFKPVSNSN